MGELKTKLKTPVLKMRERILEVGDSKLPHDWSPFEIIHENMDKYNSRFYWFTYYSTGTGTWTGNSFDTKNQSQWPEYVYHETGPTLEEIPSDRMAIRSKVDLIYIDG